MLEDSVILVLPSDAWMSLPLILRSPAIVVNVLEVRVILVLPSDAWISLPPIRRSLLTTTTPVPFGVNVILPFVFVELNTFPSNLKLSISSKVLISTLPVNVELPATFKFSPIPTPPLTIRAPFPNESEDVVFLILTWPLNVTASFALICLLNVTGPSNCERIVPESPPSTRSLSLTVTSS